MDTIDHLIEWGSMDSMYVDRIILGNGEMTQNGENVLRGVEKACIKPLDSHLTFSFFFVETNWANWANEAGSRTSEVSWLASHVSHLTCQME